MLNDHTDNSVSPDSPNVDWGTYLIQDRNGEGGESVSTKAQDNPKYRITTYSIGNGTCTVPAASESAGNTVSINIQPDDGYELYSLHVTTGSNSVYLDEEHCFIMPSSDVKVTASFVKKKNPGQIWKTVLGTFSWITAIALMLAMIFY